MNHTLTLEAVQKDFQQWRLSRKKRTSIPDDLWQRVFSTLNRYPISKICSALSLNTAQIRSILKPVSTFKDGKSKETFVVNKLTIFVIVTIFKFNKIPN